jgi:PXA domain
VFIIERLLPLLFQTFDRYIHTMKTQSSMLPVEFLRQMYATDLHIAMYNRQTELKYLQRLIVGLMPIVTPNFIYDCQGSRHFLRELCVGQIVIDGIDVTCQPDTINRLFHLYFTMANQRRHVHSNENFVHHIDQEHVELLTHFCTIEDTSYKNRLALNSTDVFHEKELMNQFRRVLERHGSLSLATVYLLLSDILNDIPLASDILVRKKIYQRLKHIDDRETYIVLSHDDRFIDSIRKLIYDELYVSIDETNVDNNNNKQLDIQLTFSILSQFHCRIYELLQDKYQQCFLPSDEHFLYICGHRMDSPDYCMLANK